MGHRVDEILAAIDVGLQNPEPDRYRDVSPVNHGLCVRCEARQTLDRSEFCGPCRSYLLGDGHELPQRAPVVTEYPNGGFRIDYGEIDLEAVRDQFLNTPSNDFVIFPEAPTGCWWACENPGRPTDGYVRWHYFNCAGCFDRARLLLADHPDDTHVRWLANRIGIT